MTDGYRSMTETADTDEPDDPLLRERKLHSIVPAASVAGTALTLVIAIMTFLASLTLGAVTLVNDTAKSWQSDVASEVTIQVRPVEGLDIEAALISARQIASETPGVTDVGVVGSDAMAKLLEPWLGSGLDLAALPVPQLISVTVDADDPPDLPALKARLEKTVPGASLDDHRAWVDRLTAMAQTTVVAGFVVFILMLCATVLTVIFATRGAMSGNAQVIEVLHFVGAELSFIAGEFQKRFLMLGLKGALAGGLLAIVVFLIATVWSRTTGPGPAAEQAAALFGTFSIGVMGYVGVLLLIFVVALLTALTSRLTVLRNAGSLDRSADEV